MSDERDPGTIRGEATLVMVRHRIMTRNAGGRTGCRGCTWQSSARAGSDAAYFEHAEHLAAELLDAGLLR